MGYGHVTVRDGFENAMLCKRIQDGVWFRIWRFGFELWRKGVDKLEKSGNLLWDGAVEKWEGSSGEAEMFDL